MACHMALCRTATDPTKQDPEGSVHTCAGGTNLHPTTTAPAAVCKAEQQKHCSSSCSTFVKAHVPLELTGLLLADLALWARPAAAAAAGSVHIAAAAVCMLVT